MKKIFTLLILGSLFFHSKIFAQPCANYFELVVEPTITNTTSAGKLLSAEIKISLNNLSFIPEMELFTMQNAIGLTDLVTSFNNHSGVSTEMVGGQVATDEFPLNPPATANGHSYTSWLIYGHSVDGTAASPPQIIGIGDTACIATITLNFDGTQLFTDDINEVNDSVNYILDPSFIAVLPGNDIANNPTVLNNFGSTFPNGFPMPLSCYNTVSDATVLAISLFDFNGRSTPNGNQLNWSVLNETEVAYHEVERRLDEEDEFKAIYKATGINRSAALSQYSFSDRIKAEKAYYRVKSVEESGEVSFSEILVLHGDLSQNLVLYPNPILDRLNVQYSSEKEQETTFAIIDPMGKVQFLTTRNITEGNNLIQLNLESLPAGNYTLQIQNQDQRMNNKIIKL